MQAEFRVEDTVVAAGAPARVLVGEPAAGESTNDVPDCESQNGSCGEGERGKGKTYSSQGC